MLALIPARAGSKRLPGKNLRLFQGLPLIAITILAAKKSTLVDRVVVTTDSEDIAEIARQFGAEVPFLRPKDLAGDESGSVEVCCHALEELKAQEFVLLQPTSPLRKAIEIDEAVCLFRSKKADSVISVTEISRPENSLWPKWVGTNGEILSYLKGETAQPSFRLAAPNGAIYIASHSLLLKEESFYSKSSFAFWMPQERSIDIDTEADFIRAEHYGRAESR